MAVILSCEGDAGDPVASIQQGLAGAETVTRGPYLQSGTSTSVIVRWRTDSPTDGRVVYGSTAAALSLQVLSPTVSTEHEIKVQGLTPGTQYFYGVGSSTAVLSSGADSFFYTSPAPGTAKATRFWALGDAGTNTAGQRAVRDAYKNLMPVRRTDFILALGDNAYNSGTDNEYQKNFFEIYPTFFKQVAIWSTLGNHETGQSVTPPPDLPYFQSFTFPTAGEAGGVPSGTERYYAFDYGNLHVICLDSMTSNRAPMGAMATWLKADLAMNTHAWIVAFFHHPLYSRGSHNSDDDGESIDMRAGILPILEQGGVDIVLMGHSHVYERSFLLDGHYGPASTLTASMKKNSGDGRPSGGGAYSKPTAGPAAHEGAVYVVTGSAGQTSGTHSGLNHPANFVSMDVLGSLVVDVDNLRLDAQFLRETGVIGDTFSLIKGPTSVLPAPSNLVATVAMTRGQIDLVWTDASTNEDGFRIERSTDGLTWTEVATVLANVTVFSSGGLANDSAYFFRARAHSAAGFSMYSNVVMARTRNCTPEICDGKDNDCNGLIDETFPDRGAMCSVGVGACVRAGIKVCAVDGRATVCNVAAGAATAEICGDRVDNDCNGMIDENCLPEPPRVDAGFGGLGSGGVVAPDGAGGSGVMAGAGGVMAGAGGAMAGAGGAMAIGVGGSPSDIPKTEDPGGAVPAPTEPDPEDTSDSDAGQGHESRLVLRKGCGCDLGARKSTAGAGTVAGGIFLLMVSLVAGRRRRR